MQALGRQGDLVIGISTSGNSENVLRAVNYARTHRDASNHCFDRRSGL